jgi:DNA repair exonuclease SbcCD nuclease subunit
MFKFAELCINRQIPFAVIFGNHDDEGDMSRQELMDFLLELPYCVAKPGFEEIDGIGNYVVAIERPGLHCLEKWLMIKNYGHRNSTLVSGYT